MTNKPARCLLRSVMNRGLATAITTMTVLTPVSGIAQTADPGLGLVGLPYANDVEQAAAEANQAVFNALDASCNPGGIFDTEPEPDAPPSDRVQ